MSIQKSFEKPTDTETVEYTSSYQSRCQTAANAIRNADFLLIATGAGWSADSGLPTYSGVADIEAYKVFCPYEYII